MEGGEAERGGLGMGAGGGYLAWGCVGGPGVGDGGEM